VKPLEKPSPAALARVVALSQRRLSAEEARAALAVPLSEAEEAESRSLIRWFRRRYPTPATRLAYARRAYRRWAMAQPVSPAHEGAEGP
jgi:hypothetical protein